MLLRNLSAGYGLLAVLFVMSMLPVRAEVTDGVIRIGVLTDLTGAYSAAAGDGSLTAAELAAQRLGSALKGVRVEFRVADHRNDPGVAEQQARELHQGFGADLIIDMPSSAAALGAQRYAAGNDVVIIHTGSGTELLTGEHCSPNSVHWQYNTGALTAGLGEAVAEPGGGQGWYVIALDHPFGYGVHQGLEAAVARSGDHILGARFHPFDEQDFFPLLEEAIASGADVIALGNAGRGLAAAIRQAKELGVDGRGVRLAGVLTLREDVRAVGRYAASGLRFVAPYYWEQNAGSREFADVFQARYGARPASNHIAVHTATLHYLKAVAETGHSRGAVVVDAMKAMPVDDGITRNGRVRVDGRMVHDLNLVEVK
ncbi:MAG: ABC transporter substrate-binding protein, partial [Ectothiorhodospiraceae bacterium]|nr:ABC transporter substrate-binding protein [Ectothiorhodospiraceae bacterium]